MAKIDRIIAEKNRLAAERKADERPKKKKVKLSRKEAQSVYDYIMGDGFSIEPLDSAVAKLAKFLERE